MARRLEEGISNAGAPPSGEQVPPVKEDANVDPTTINPPTLKDGYIRASPIQFVQAATVQAQAVMDKANLELVPRTHQQLTTMASQLRDFTRINPPTLYRS